MPYFNRNVVKIDKNTSSGKYIVMDINPAKILRKEMIGARLKYWYKDENQVEWLIKYPRRNTGEHWSEKAAHEIAKYLEIDSAQIEFAKVKGIKCTVSKSFIKNNQEHHFEGKEYLKTHVGDYESEINPTKHSVENILHVLKIYGCEITFAKYLLLDAIIGNTDRHDENWGFIASTQTILSPTYDHASSMGRELLDSKRNKILIENTIPDYSNDCKCKIYMDENDNEAANPIELFHKFCNDINVDVETEVVNKEKLEELLKTEIKAIFSKMPHSFISSSAKRFAKIFIKYNIKKIINTLEL